MLELERERLYEIDLTCLEEEREEMKLKIEDAKLEEKWDLFEMLEEEFHFLPHTVI